MKRIAILFLTTIIAGCSLISKQDDKVRAVYITTPLYLPDRPELPTWSGEDMECLSEEMKDKIRERDLSRKHYAEQLETIIKSTQK